MPILDLSQEVISLCPHPVSGLVVHLPLNAHAFRVAQTRSGRLRRWRLKDRPSRRDVTSYYLWKAGEYEMVANMTFHPWGERRTRICLEHDPSGEFCAILVPQFTCRLRSQDMEQWVGPTSRFRIVLDGPPLPKVVSSITSNPSFEIPTLWERIGEDEPV